QDGQFRGQLPTDFIHSMGFTSCQRLGPAVPTLPVEPVAKRIEQNKVFQPPFILLAEVVEFVSRMAGCTRQEVIGRLAQQGKFVVRYWLGVDLARRPGKSFEP